MPLGFVCVVPYLGYQSQSYTSTTQQHARPYYSTLMAATVATASLGMPSHL